MYWKIALLLVAIAASCSSDTPVFSAKALRESLGIAQVGKRILLHRGLDRARYGMARQVCHELCHEQGIGKNISPIPRLIHQIWLEEVPLPDSYASAQQSWRILHPSWEVRLWTKSDLQEFLHAFPGLDLFSLPKAIARDLFAAAILLKMGGVIVDVQVECVRPIDDLMVGADLVTSFDPPLKKACFGRRLHLSPAVVASCCGHPLIAAWKEEMRLRLTSLPPLDTQKRKVVNWYTVDAFGEAFDHCAFFPGTSPRILGPTLFCPLSPSYARQFQKELAREKKKSRFQRVLWALKLQDRPLFSTVNDETRSYHQAGGRWGKDQRGED